MNRERAISSDNDFRVRISVRNMPHLSIIIRIRNNHTGRGRRTIGERISHQLGGMEPVSVVMVGDILLEIAQIQVHIKITGEQPHLHLQG